MATLRDLERTLPNGFHDTKVRSCALDYVQRTALFQLDVWTGDLDATDPRERERYRSAALFVSGLAFCQMEPPDPTYPFQESAPLRVDASESDVPNAIAVKLPQGAFSARLYVANWNAFIRLAASDAALLWDDARSPGFENIGRYLQSRASYRDTAVAAFREREPDALPLLQQVGELVARTTFFASGRPFDSFAGGLYIGDLIVSFCRSHFLTADLVQNGELIACAAILRKQMELVARIHELGVLDETLLAKQVPNLKHLPERVRRLYGEYSRLAHSADPESIRLLGYLPGEDGKIYTPLYAEFTANAYVALNHVCLVALEFHTVVAAVYQKYFLEYEPTGDRELRDRVLALLGSSTLARAAHQ